MFKSFFSGCLFCFCLLTQGFPQSSPQLVTSKYSYHPPSEDKPSWQWLNLWLSANYCSSTIYQTVDSSLIFVSRSLGLSRLAIAAEGIDDPELIAQSTWFDKRRPGEGTQLLSKTTGKKRLELMTLLGAYYAFQIDRQHKNRDSAAYFLTRVVDEIKAPDEKSLGRIALSLLVKMYSVLGDREKSDQTIARLSAECRAANDKKTEARALTYRGIYEGVGDKAQVTQADVTDIFQRRIGYLEKAREIYHSLKDTEGEIVAITNIGYFNMIQERSDESYQLFLKALELENSIGYPYTHYTTDMIAMISSNQGKFGEPLKYCLETVRTAEAARDSIAYASFYSRLGLLYLMEGHRNEESLKWMYKALDRFIAAKNPAVYQTAYNIISILTTIPGRQKEALDLAFHVSKKVPPQHPSDSIFHHITFAYGYMGTKQFKLAEQYGLAADSILRFGGIMTANISYQRSMIYNTLGSVYFASGQYSNAKRYLEMDLADELRPATLLNDLETYKQLIFIDSVFRDAPAAVKHYRQYVLLIDSNFRSEKVKQAEELQVFYKTEEKEKEIIALNKQAKLEQANLKQATLVKNLTIAGIIAALIIAGLLYRQSRLRKKNSELISHKNDLLEHLLIEKEWLLKEIHHRVKNNLQTVMSLLNSQSAYIDNAPALTAIQDSQHRVHAMSLIHQKLYNTDNVSSIAMSFYIPELVSYLSDSFNTGQRIRFELDIEPLEMDVSQAVPLGLILNEAITNSIKYAFPGNRGGLIKISLCNTSPDHYLLSISDNGIGMPDHLQNKKPGSLGMSLMEGLSEDLDGSFSIENNNGTTINISFAQDLSAKRPERSVSSFVNSN